MQAIVNMGELLQIAANFGVLYGGIYGVWRFLKRS
jgi:hypothetical protein